MLTVVVLRYVHEATPYPFPVRLDLSFSPLTSKFENSQKIKRNHRRNLQVVQEVFYFCEIPTNLYQSRPKKMTSLTQNV